MAKESPPFAINHIKTSQLADVNLWLSCSGSRSACGVLYIFHAWMNVIGSAHATTPHMSGGCVDTSTSLFLCSCVFSSHWRLNVTRPIIVLLGNKNSTRTSGPWGCIPAFPHNKSHRRSWILMPLPDWAVLPHCV